MLQNGIANQQIKAAVFYRKALAVVKNHLDIASCCRVHPLGLIAADVVDGDVLTRNIQTKLVPEMA